MLSKREIELLIILEKNHGQYVSSAQLAELIGVSDRTARKYMHQLSAVIENYGATLTSKQGYGYLLEITNLCEFNLFLQQVQQSKKTLTKITQVEESVDRQRYILNKLFFENEPLYFETLMQELYISRTTLNNALNDIREKLKPYQLRFVNNKAGIKVKGDEENIRHFMSDYFFGDTLDDSVLTFVGETLFEACNYTEIVMIILEESRKESLKLSDYVVHNLVLHIGLTVRRIHLGNQLEDFKIPEEMQQTHEYFVALKILYRLEALLNIQFPIEETNYIALHLSVKQSQVLLGSLENQMDIQVSQQITSAIQIMSEQIEMDLTIDQLLFQGILAHINPLIIRLENKIQLSNPLVSEITKNYHEIFSLTKDTFMQLALLQRYEISDDEWAYITLHVLAAIERKASQNKPRVLVVCATGIGSAMMLKNRLENVFGSSLVIADVVGYYDLNVEKLRDIDLIISSINLSNLLFLTPVVNVSVFLTQEDVDNIRQYLNQPKPVNSMQINKEPALAEKINALQASDLFKFEQFTYFEEEMSRDEILAIMIEQLEEGDDATFRDEFLEEIKLRESYSPVVYGNILAFPHPTTQLSINEQIVVGVCRRPIWWSEEYPQVQFIFLLSPSKVFNQKLKIISQCLVKFVEETSLQQQLIISPNYQTLIEIFTKLLNE